MREINLILKRFFDVVASLIAIALFMIIPVFIIVPIVIRLTSKGPALFRQKRIGINCKQGRQSTYFCRFVKCGGYNCRTL